MNRTAGGESALVSFLHYWAISNFLELAGTYVGDVIVSKMIGSLSTVLDYRMNRANVKEIHLAEEL